MKKAAKRGRVLSEINITPFTDVVLVLLIIFMIATPVLLQPGIKIELPKARAAENTAEKNLSISIAGNGDIYIDGQKIDNGALKDEIAAKISNKPDTPVIIKGDKTVKYDLVVKVIDAARSSGVKKFALGVGLEDGSGSRANTCNVL